MPTISTRPSSVAEIELAGDDVRRTGARPERWSHSGPSPISVRRSTRTLGVHRDTPGGAPTRASRGSRPPSRAPPCPRTRRRRAAPRAGRRRRRGGGRRPRRPRGSRCRRGAPRRRRRRTRAGSRRSRALLEMSTPRVGSSSASTCGLLPTAAAIATFCWLPPLERADRRCRSPRALTWKLVRSSLGDRAHPAAADARARRARSRGRAG